MKRLWIPLLLTALLVTACAPGGTPPPPTRPPLATAAPLPSLTPVPTPIPTPVPTDGPAPTPVPAPVALQRPAQLQIGLNFIRFYLDNLPGTLNTTTPYLQPEAIFADFHELGIHTYRQFIAADLLWDIVEPQDGRWNFQAADAVLTNPDFEPIVTLFALQYASPTPPWASGPEQFQKTLGPEAMDYLETVVARYGPYVKYWELGNEMNHWRAADPGESTSGDQSAAEGHPMPASVPADGFSPQEQGLFLAQAAAFIRARDPDAVIVMPGMGGIDDHALNVWFAGVIEGGGTEWFDVVNYHYYPGWEPYYRGRAQLQDFIESHALTGKPVWLTETGSTASPSLTYRTDYPNSPESQAADIFRRILPAYGAGDALVIWHTYIDSRETPTNVWRLYGVRSDRGEAHPSYYALRLLIEELIPFAQVTTLEDDPRGVNAFRVTTQAGAVRYVVWGSGTYPVPDGVTQAAQVVPDAQGNPAWQSVQPGEPLALSEVPLLLR